MTPEKIYERLYKEGAYQHATLDLFEIKKICVMATEDYEFGRRLCKLEKPNWRVIFNIHYDALREICEQMLRFHALKVSNHQGVFVAIALHEHISYDFLEKIRLMRNKNKYQCLDIPEISWKEVRTEFEMTLNTLLKRVGEHLNAI
jgi:hypothetical protein